MIRTGTDSRRAPAQGPAATADRAVRRDVRIAAAGALVLGGLSGLGALASLVMGFVAAEWVGGLIGGVIGAVLAGGLGLAGVRLLAFQVRGANLAMGILGTISVIVGLTLSRSVRSGGISIERLPPLLGLLTGLLITVGVLYLQHRAVQALAPDDQAKAGPPPQGPPPRAPYEPPARGPYGPPGAGPAHPPAPAQAPAPRRTPGWAIATIAVVVGVLAGGGGVYLAVGFGDPAGAGDTPESAAQAEPGAGPAPAEFDPCTIPDHAIGAAGFDPAPKLRRAASDGNGCAWRNSRGIDLVIVRSTKTLATPPPDTITMTYAGRVGHQNCSRGERHLRSSCVFSYAISGGSIRLQFTGKVDGLAPRPHLAMAMTELTDALPPSLR